MQVGLYQFRVEYEASGMRVSSYRSEAMALNWEKGLLLSAVQGSPQRSPTAEMVKASDWMTPATHPLSLSFVRSGQEGNRSKQSIISLQQHFTTHSGGIAECSTPEGFIGPPAISHCYSEMSRGPDPMPQLHMFSSFDEGEQQLHFELDVVS